MDETKSVAIDAMAPWTIKSFPTAARQRIVRAAEIQGVTVGQFIEGLLERWEANGSENRVVNLVSERRLGLAVQVVGTQAAQNWLRAGAGRLLAAELGIEVPKTRPGTRRLVGPPEGAGER